MADFIGATSAQLDMSMNHVILQFIGVLGSLTYVCIFFLLQSGRLCGNGILYPACQLCAAICVAASLTTAFNLAAFVIQISFIAIALYGIWFRLSGRIAANRDRSGAFPAQVVTANPARCDRWQQAEVTKPVITDLRPTVTARRKATSNRAA